MKTRRLYDGEVWEEMMKRMDEEWRQLGRRGPLRQVGQLQLCERPCENLRRVRAIWLARLRRMSWMGLGQVAGGNMEGR